MGRADGRLVGRGVGTCTSQHPITKCVKTSARVLPFSVCLIRTLVGVVVGFIVGAVGRTVGERLGVSVGPPVGSCR